MVTRSFQEDWRYGILGRRPAPCSATTSTSGPGETGGRRLALTRGGTRPHPSDPVPGGLSQRLGRGARPFPGPVQREPTDVGQTYGLLGKRMNKTQVTTSKETAGSSWTANTTSTASSPWATR